MNRPALSRRTLLAALPATALGLAAAAPARATPVTVYQDPNCGCCGGWVTHMRRAGFAVTQVRDPNMAARKRTLGVPNSLASCHTATVGNYVVEGHVPPADVRRLLSARPPVLGIAAPGMPIGSPGMETPNGQTEPYVVMTFDREGNTTVFARHG